MQIPHCPDGVQYHDLDLQSKTFLKHKNGWLDKDKDKMDNLIYQ